MKSASSPTPILQVDHLCKRFHAGHGVVEAVRDISLTLSRGEFAAVMGASGSGKSTLLHLVAGLTRPDEGVVRIADTNLHALSERARTLFRRQNIGLIFQAFNLIPALTGEENIALPLLLGGQRGDGHDVARLVTELGLDGICRRRPDSMSGGEQQRVAIGRALVTRPALVLADEPTGSLDSVNGRRLCDTFRRLCRENGTTVLMVTHNPAVAFAAEKILIIKDGRLVGQFPRSDFASVQDLGRHYLQIMESDREEVRA